MNNIRNFAILSSLIVGLLSLGSCKEKSSDVKVFSLQKSDYHSWSELISVEKVIQLQENDSCLMSYAAPDSFAKKILTQYKIAPDKNSPVIVKFRLSENALSD